MIAYFSAAIYVQLVVFVIFGGSKEALQQQQKQAQVEEPPRHPAY